MYYKRHIFFCCNQKNDGTGGCKNLGGEEAFTYAKDLLQKKLLWGKDLYRASKSGCLGRCNSGPVCIIYPDGTWYSYVDLDDVKEIIEHHLINGNKINRLKLDN